MWVKIGGEQNKIWIFNRYPSRYPRISKEKDALKVLGSWRVHSSLLLFLGKVQLHFTCSLGAKLGWSCYCQHVVTSI